jgi:hypothetical protein
MRRSLTLALLLALPTGDGLSAQVLDDLMVPRGRVRLQMFPVYTSWDSRFGRTATGVTGREALGEDLTSESAETLFPGSASLTAAIASMNGSPGYSPVLGTATGRVTKDITRVEFGGHIGIFDWLTIGAVLPWTRTRTNVDVYFTPDTLSGDLGLNPRSNQGAAVVGFLQALSSADAAAQTNASSVCGSSPGSPACASAQALADRTGSFSSAASDAYNATPFFPMGGTPTAADLDAATSQLDADLVAAGLPGIGTAMVFATEWVTEDDLGALSNTAGFGVEAAIPLGDVRPLWHVGDLEVSASVRLLEGLVRDSAAASPTLAYRVIGTVLARLPTGAIDNPDVFLDVPTGDGQTDFEGRVVGEVVWGQRLGLRAGGRYGIQQPRTLIRRVAAPEQVMASVLSRQLVEWNPGAYFGIEVAPSFLFSPELSVAAEYRVHRKYRDEYTLTGPSVGAPYDPVVMQIESGETVHHVGGILRYDTVARRMASGSGTPLQLHLRVQKAVAGGGGQTPVTTRLEFGIRFFRRFWGEP